jgi:hypothetical protein
MKYFMKLISILLLLVVTACGERKLTGYIVYKSYMPRHMCHNNTEPVVEAGYVHVPHNTHHHTEQEPTWTLYVGNASRTIEIDVTENCYNDFKVTDKVRVYGNYVELIKKGCR